MASFRTGKWKSGESCGIIARESNEKERTMPMLKISACDDDDFTLRQIGRMLETAVRKSREDAGLVCLARSGNDLLRSIASHEGPNLIFMDYDLGRQSFNGMDLVRYIYDKDQNARIVFVTSYGDKALEILQSGVRPFGFIEKNPDGESMIRAFVRYIRMAAEEIGEKTTGKDGETEDEVQKVSLPIGIDETAEVPVTDIVYLDSDKSMPHCICCHLLRGSDITFRDTLDRWEEKLGDPFFRCHRSILVNTAMIVGMHGGFIRLSDGDDVPCAVGKRRYVQEHFL